MSVADIAHRAQQIRKVHPKMAWQDAIKKASKELKGKVSGVKSLGKKLLQKRL